MSRLGSPFPSFCILLLVLQISCATSAVRKEKRNLQRAKPPNPSVGDFKTLVLLVQFTDHQDGRTLVDKSTVKERITIMKNWFSANSQGVYEIEPVVTDWVLTDNTEEFYSAGKRGMGGDLKQAIIPALDALDNNKDWDWSEFDTDKDGELDSVIFIHSGFDYLAGGQDCFNQREAMERIQAHAYTSCANCWESADGSVSLNGFAVGSAYSGNCDDEAFEPGLLTHEYMHTMGLVDLYDGQDLLAAKGCGAWDIMAHPYGPKNSGIPSFLSAWSRSEAKWLTFQNIKTDGTYTIRPAQTSQESYQIFLSDQSQDKEYLLIENRQQLSFDEDLWDSGLLIYHIDDAANGMNNRGFPGQPGWPENGNHYQVAVLPKDGNYDLEQNVNIGDAGDMWLPGDSLGPGKGGTVYPNTDRYQKGNIIETGITITVLAQEGEDIIFEVIGLTSYYNDNKVTPGTTDRPPDDYAHGATNGESSSLPPYYSNGAPKGSLPESASISWLRMSTLTLASVPMTFAVFLTV